MTLYQQVEKHPGAVDSLDFTSKSNYFRLFGLMEYFDWRCCEVLLGNCRLLDCPMIPRISWLFLHPFSLKCFTNTIKIHASDLLFGPYCYGYNIQLNLPLKNSCSFAGSGRLLVVFDSTIPPMALRRWNGDRGRCRRIQTSTDGCSAGLQVEPRLMFNH